MFQWPETAEAGELLGPAEIPVEPPTRFELVVNLEVAKAIGHQVPAGLLARTDKIIE
jgi:putative tryptophan/tyrosine transport system substrate-binding protein